MKKILLLVSILIGTNFGNAQQLVNENCTALTVGNISTSLTGGTAGQGGWYTYTNSAAAGSLSDYQVVDKGAVNGKCFQITGSNTASTSTISQVRWLFNDVSTNWTNRTSGNNICEVEFDYFTGTVSTTKVSDNRIVLFNTGYTKILAALTIDVSNNDIYGAAYATVGTSTGTKFYNLDTSTVTLEPNTWYRLGLSYNYTTGKVIWKEGTGLFNSYVNGAAANTDIFEFDFMNIPFTGNTASGVGIYDNISIKAVASDSLLKVGTFVTPDSFAVTPNPASDYFNITSADNIGLKSISLTDMNGREIKSINYENVSSAQINVSDLTAGMYLMQIKSDKGNTTKKVMVK